MLDVIRKRPHGDLLFEEPDAAEAPRQKKVRFPKGKKEGQGRTVPAIQVFEGEEDGGPVLSTDPRVAAKERAIQRTVLAEQLINSEDISIVDDVVAAEEEGGEGRTEGGITIEPFNLDQEREEGYFDAEGNYVEYQLDENDKDAWFETVQVDESLPKKIKEKEKAKDQSEDAELTQEEVWVIQKRISDTLLPEETVLQALRRFRGITRDKKRGERMSGSTKILFDRLTEDAMKLLDNGDYNIYHEQKETLQREAEGYEALARARRGEPSGSDGISSRSIETNGNGAEGRSDNIIQLEASAGADSSFDMFGDDDDVVVNVRSEAGVSGNDLDMGTQTRGDTVSTLPGYVYDENSGYYYNAADGYFYDSKTGYFCNAASGKWFYYEGASALYVEVTETGETVVVADAVAAEM